MANDWMITGRTLDNYLAACQSADLSNFKQDQRLTKIFEHTTRTQGFNYLATIHNNAPGLLGKIFSNDDKGGANVQRFGQYAFSASSLQYIAVLAMLVQQFGALDGLHIVEIGGGYGGQARIITDVYDVAAYHIIDLPEVCKLQGRYLADRPIQSFTEPTGLSYDLVISNYALSEIPHCEQYINEVLAKAKHGYITCNTDFVQLSWEHKRLPDISGEPDNFILIW